MKTIIHLILIVISIVFYSCEKTIIITRPAYLSRPSIQCMLEPDSLPVVYLNRTVPFFNENQLFKDLIIRNARIKIESSTGTDSLKLDSVYDKSFCQYNFYYKGNIPVQLNNTYTLTVTSGALTYTAFCQTNQLKPAIDSINYTPEFFDLYGGHEGVIVYFKDIPT